MNENIVRSEEAEAVKRNILERDIDPFSLEVGRVVADIDRWLDSMHGPEGYGGPVVHWWQNSLLYSGPGLDWRYEGIIIGYLNLYQRTDDQKWLAKACRAGDDLVKGQLPGGNYRNSSFELNPLSGGTPHEAACDLALFRLAQVLKQNNFPGWQIYAAAAKCNLREFVLGKLWDDTQEIFRNTVADPSFVPNKAATIVEALFAWMALSEDEEWLDRFTRLTLDSIISSQIREHGSPLDGAIFQAVSQGSKNGRFFPLYISRCIPALLLGYRFWGQDHYLDAARSAMAFIQRFRFLDGSFPQVIYQNGRVNRYPQWVAGVGDILRAMNDMAAVGIEQDTGPIQAWLLQGADRSAAIATAWGFTKHISQGRPPIRHDFRDLLPVCGWVDKAFRYLTGQLQEELPKIESGPIEILEPCIFSGRTGAYIESDAAISFRRGEETIYCWPKGATWARQSLS